MINTPLVYVDIETNGGNGPRGRIIEIAAIKVQNGQIIDEFTSLVNPGSDIPFWITNLTGIQQNDLVDAPYFEDIAMQLFIFLDASLFVAHNVLFDYSFIKRELKTAGIVYNPKLFCTVRMSRALYPHHNGHSLEKIIKRHSITVNSRHRAYDDALALHKFVQIASKEHGKDAILDNIKHQTKTRSLPPNVDETVVKNLPDSPGIYIFEDDQGYPLYVGKSINIRHRVKSHFTNATSIAKEMKMSLGSHNISYQTTDTEIEALLLESAKVKELQPLLNVKLRRKSKQSLFIRQFDQNGYTKIHIENKDLAEYNDLENIYGVFTTKRKATAHLESLIKTYQLCSKLMGLEKSSGSCFRYQLRLCKGACVGKESSRDYNLRVEQALEKSKIDSWPFKSAVEVAISQTKTLVIDQWVIKSLNDYTFDVDKVELDNKFDIDTYKILRNFMKTKPKISLL
jgi:DNA polymerase-3 subunit epsilon